jgi:hypothetical protein
VISAKPYTPYHSTKTSSGKQFKCEHQGCRYAASRRDHVRSHFKAYHDGNPFECGKWCAYSTRLLISLLTRVFQPQDVRLSGGSPLPRTLQYARKRASCYVRTLVCGIFLLVSQLDHSNLFCFPLSGYSVNKKGLKRHQDTPKCKTNQIAR